MIKEIALHCMKSASQCESELCEECPIYGETGSDHCFEDALQYVIGMLEQEPILDKIRAEVEALEYLNIEDGSDGYDKYIEQYEVLKIIDKHKGESEVEK